MKKEDIAQSQRSLLNGLIHLLDLASQARDEPSCSTTIYTVMSTLAGWARECGCVRQEAWIKMAKVAWVDLELAEDEDADHEGEELDS